MQTIARRLLRSFRSCQEQRRLSRLPDVAGYPKPASLTVDSPSSRVISASAGLVTGEPLRSGEARSGHSEREPVMIDTPTTVRKTASTQCKGLHEQARTAGPAQIATGRPGRGT